MPTNSPLRRFVKRRLAKFRGHRVYLSLQALAMAWDIWSGAWSESELDLIDSALEPDENAIDIGANFGLWTHHLGRRISSGRVIAFEPIPSTHATLCLIGKILRFRHVEIHALGCSDKSERVAFSAPLQDSGAIAAGLAHLRITESLSPGSREGRRASESQEFWGDVVALDEFLPELEGVAFVKCDIEGAELLALRGAERLIRRNLPTVVCEVQSSYPERFGFKVEDVVRFFMERQYRIYHYERDPSPALRDAQNLRGTESPNVVFIHPSRLHRFSSLLQASTTDERTSI